MSPSAYFISIHPFINGNNRHQHPTQIDCHSTGVNHTDVAKHCIAGKSSQVGFPMQYRLGVEVKMSRCPCGPVLSLLGAYPR